MTIDGMTVMVPVHTAPASGSPYFIEQSDGAGHSLVLRDGLPVGSVSFPPRPRFYDLATADGIPYSQIAVLHGRDVLATTVLQSCVRYQNRAKSCQFCAIGQSLAAGRTIERKTPAQLAEVAKAAGALTIGIVTRPFGFEGRRRAVQAENGIQRMREKAPGLAIVVLSYRQTIRAYPSGGGSYIVASDNLGETAGLTAGGVAP